jgi:hypothetical protein
MQAGRVPRPQRLIARRQTAFASLDEALPTCGSYEVRFQEGSESRFFYWDDLPSRRVRPDIFTREQALELAKAFARAVRDKDGL